jgi:hypothetical protein
MAWIPLTHALSASRPRTRSGPLPVSSNGVPIQDISDTLGHKSTHVTETVYRHVIVPEIRGGATVMDGVFDDDEDDTDEGSANAENT